jgi:hypothetical protein
MVTVHPHFFVKHNKKFQTVIAPTDIMGVAKT